MKKANFIVILLLCLLASVDMEAKKKPLGNGLYWELSENGTLTISGNGDMPNFERAKDIPWAKSSIKIRKVIIEAGITSIGENAFISCKFSSIILPESLVSIGSSAFGVCQNLHSIIIPDKVTSIGTHCFYNCTELKKVQLPKSLSIIPDYCFYGCTELTEVNFHNQLTAIGAQAFYNNKIKVLNVPNSIKAIGEKAFNHYDYRDILNIPYAKLYKGEITSLPSFINENNCEDYGLSVESVRSYKNGIHEANGYLIVAAKEGRQIKRVGNTDSYIIKEGNYTGVINTQRKWVIPWSNTYSDIESIGANYLKVKHNGFYGIVTLEGKEIIPTNREYTSIDSYNNSKRTFAFTKKGMKGVCDATGKEISTTRLAPTADDIKESGNYSNAIAMTNGGKKYYKVNKNGHYGLTDAEGRVIVPTEMDALEDTEIGYLKFKLNGFWGLMDYAGKIIIDTSRGYTSIGKFISFTKRFPYTMTGYKGECDLTGKEISRIKVATPQQSTASSSSSSSSSNSNGNSGNNSTTVVVEHHRDPVPVQEWQQCFACYGSGQCSYVKCGGSGWYYIGDRMTTCSMCHGSGKCTTCAGRGGQNVTVYR